MLDGEAITTRPISVDRGMAKLAPVAVVCGNRSQADWLLPLFQRGHSCRRTIMRSSNDMEQ